MTFLTVRASTISRLAAFVLLLSMMSPFIANSSPADPLAVTTRVAESASNEVAALDALIQPPVSLVIEPRLAAVRLDAPPIVTKMRTRADEILRL